MTTTETTETKTNTTLKDSQIAIIAAKFAEQEKAIQEAEETIRLLREFFAKHREALAPFHWRNYGWHRDIIFSCRYGDNTAKEIATAFGAEGWTRSHDDHACGSINWSKTIDGVPLKIEGAENIRPKLIDEVKL